MESYLVPPATVAPPTQPPVSEEAILYGDSRKYLLSLLNETC